MHRELSTDSYAENYVPSLFYETVLYSSLLYYFSCAVLIYNR